MTDYYIDQVPTAIRQCVDRRKALPEFQQVRWTVRDGLLWICCNYWILCVGPAEEHTCTGERAGWAFDLLKRPLPPSVEKGEQHYVAAGGIYPRAFLALRVGRAWVNPTFIEMVEDINGPCEWHHDGDLFDPLFATRKGTLRAVVMPLRYDGGGQ